MRRNHSPQDADPRSQTHWSLVDRLKAADAETWRSFAADYGRVFYNLALRAGCTAIEAQEVEQSTLVSVSGSLKNFETDSTKGRFRDWLFKIARRRIADQIRQRPDPNLFRGPSGQTGTDSPFINKIPADPARLCHVFEQEWQACIAERCLKFLKSKTNPKHYEIFHLAVVKEKPVTEVARAMGISSAQVYLVKFRLNALLRKERSRLEAE
jgi:RNA polymerase sigma factor (sigma-70 family)